MSDVNPSMINEKLVHENQSLLFTGGSQRYRQNLGASDILK